MRERKKRLVWAERARVRLDFVTFLVSSFSYCKAGRFILCANRKRSSLRNLQDKTVLSIKTTGILDKLDSIGFSIIRSSYCFLLFIVSFRRCDVNITSFDCDKMVYFLEPMIKDCRQVSFHGTYVVYSGQFFNLGWDKSTQTRFKIN